MEGRKRSRIIRTGFGCKYTGPDRGLGLFFWRHKKEVYTLYQYSTKRKLGDVAAPVW